ncbi:MAG: 4Fe-4S binding protein [Desulfatitalea sp.]|nr:ATP-binding protein [Desulfatitalea sp.]NNK01642.1 4Fe-4S binding protein [Desulfatitalea sp.]
MKIAIASGKGGTGKTLVSASLAAVWERPVKAVDLDVEEPNLHLFLKPEIDGTQPAYMPVPVVDEEKCSYCRACAELCQYKAISVLGSVVMTFTDMCHGCGGCMAVCPTGAITTGRRILGEISWGRAGGAGFIMGCLRVGEAMSPPLIRQVLAQVNRKDLSAPTADVLFDAPPGVSCPAVSAVLDSDVIVLVTEPTPFGLFDLRLAHQAFAPMGKPMGVVVNRAGLGDEHVHRFCRKSGLPILAEIPYDRNIAGTYARGGIVARDMPSMAKRFVALQRAIDDLVHNKAEAHHA